MSRLFLSHSSLDNAFAVALSNWLSEQGWDDHFLDLDPERGILAGERWERSLHEAANRCEAVLFLVSRGWLSSEWCSREFDLATRLNKRLFAVLVDPDLEISEIPARFTQTWQFSDLSSGTDHELLRTVVPPHDEEVHITFSKKGLTRLRTGLHAAGLDPSYFSWPPAHDPARAPYRGLPPLEAEDAGIFFGREAPIVAALDRLRALSEKSPPRLFVVLGASGAGKSSFLRAGLLPRLQRDDRHFYPLPVIRPGGAALEGESGFLESLLGALQGAGLFASRSDLRASLSDPDAVIAHLSDLAERSRVPSGDAEAPSFLPALVIPVDQAEELFQSEGREQSDAFLKLLRAVSLSREVRVVVVLTIRTDRYEGLQTASALQGKGDVEQPLQQETFSLPPIPRGSYQTIIEGPAQRLSERDRSLEIEPELTAQLLSDIEAAGGRDALPLLAFVLQRLWQDHGGKGALRLSDYLESGRLAGAIEAGVEAAFRAADLDPSIPRHRSERETLLRHGLIPWLSGIDPATNEPRRNVACLKDIPVEARALIGHLVDARLLSVHVGDDQDFSGENSEETSSAAEKAPVPLDLYAGPLSGEVLVEPAHEALLRQWSLLRGWLEQDLYQLAALEGVLGSTRDWLANDKNDGWLAHTRGRLDEAETLYQRSDLAGRLGQDERDYLSRCRTAETERRDKELADAKALAEEQQKRAEAEAERLKEAERGKRRFRNGLIASTVAAIFAIAFGFGATWFWKQAQEQKKLAVAQTEIAETEKERAEEQTRLAELEKDKAEVQRQAAIVEKVEAKKSLSRAISLQLRSASEIPFDDRMTLILDLLPENFDEYHQNDIENYLASDQKKWPVTTEAMSAFWMANNAINNQAIFLGKIGTSTSGYPRVKFSPDGSIIAISVGNQFEIWDTSTGKVLSTLNTKYRIATFDFSETGDYLVLGSVGGELLALNVAEEKVGNANNILFWKDLSALKYIKYLPKKGVFFIVSSNSLYQLDVEATSLTLLGETGFETHGILDYTISPDENLFATGSQEDVAVLWDSKTGKELVSLSGHTADVNSVDFTSDGTMLVTSSNDKSYIVWNANSGAIVARYDGTNPNATPLFSDKPDYMLIKSSDEISISELKAGTISEIYRGHIDYAPNTILSQFSDKVEIKYDENRALIRSSVNNELKLEVSARQGIRFGFINPTHDGVMLALRDNSFEYWMFGSDGLSNQQVESVWKSYQFQSNAFFVKKNGNFAVEQDVQNASLLYVWDLSAGEVNAARDFGELLGSLMDYKISSDGKTVAFGTMGEGGEVYLWSVPDESITKLGPWVDSYGLEIGNASPYLSYFSEEGFEIWDVTTATQLAVLDYQSKPFDKGFIVGNGNVVVTNNFDGDFFVWSTVDRREITQFNLPIAVGWQESVFFSDLYSKLILVDVDGGKVILVPIYDVERRKTLNDTMSSAKFSILSENAKWFASILEDRSVAVWDVKSEVLMSKLNEVELFPEFIEFSEGKEVIIVSYSNGLVRYYDIHSFAKLGEFEFDRDEIAGLQVLQDQQMLVVFGVSGYVGVYDIGDLQQNIDTAVSAARLRFSTDLDNATKQLFGFPYKPELAHEPNSKCDRLAAHPFDPLRSNGSGTRFTQIVASEGISACIEAASKEPQQARFQFQLGRALSKNESFAEALTAYQKAADLGYPMAFYSLAIWYRKGIGTVEKDSAKAIDFFRRAFSRGVSNSGYVLGWMHWTGEGIPQDRKRALELWESAAAMGDPKSHERLAYLAELGRGGNRIDLEKALFHYATATELFEQVGFEEEAQKTRYRRASIARFLDTKTVAAMWPRVRDWEPVMVAEPTKH